MTAFRFFVNAEEYLRNAALEAFNKMLKKGGVLIANCHENSFSFLGFAYRFVNWVTRKKKYNPLSYKEFSEMLVKHNYKIENVIWYSYLPRTGWYLNFLSKYFLIPFEKAWKAIPFLPRQFSQSFIVVARKL